MFIVLLVFIIGCVPESAVDPQSMGDITEEDLEQLPEDLQPKEFEESALAGQASRWYDCEDPDSISNFDKNSLLTKSTTTYKGGSKTDRCYTWYKNTTKEKTRLIEGICKPTRSGKKFNYWYADCSSLGKDYVCGEGAGACVNSIKPCPIEEFDSIMGTPNAYEEKIWLTVLDVGESCSYDVNEKTYIVSLEKLDYKTIPGLEYLDPQPIATFKVETPTQTIVQEVSPNKFFRIENTFTIETPLYDINPLPEYRFKLHKVIPGNELKIKFERSCDDAFSDNPELNAKCDETVNNYRDLILPALEQMSGLNIGECFDELWINIEEGMQTAGASPGGYNRMSILLGQDLVSNIGMNYFGNYETHEPIHIHNACANFPGEDDTHHTYWFLREAEIYQYLGNEDVANEKYQNAKYWYGQTEADPSVLDMGVGSLGGCPGIKTHLFTKHYLETGETLINQFYDRILLDFNLLNDMNANTKGSNYFFNVAVGEVLGNSPEVINQINKYCPSNN
jgi:hypothetical protein